MDYKIGAVFEIKDNGTASIKNITNAVKTNRVAVEGMEGVYKNANGRLVDAKGKFVKVGEGAEQATKKVRLFNTNLKTNTIDSITKKLKGLLASYLGFQAVKGVGGAMISEGASMEQYRNTLNVVMKDQKKAGETMVWAKDFANRTPFETGDIVDATVKLTSYGISAKDSMTSIGDMAGVMGKSMDQAVEAIADAQTGELERLKEFGITKQQIIDHANKIMKGKEIVNNKGQITDQKAFNKTLFDLMNSRFKGGMELQSKTFTGTMSTMTGVAKDALGQIAGVAKDGTVVKGGLLDELKDGVITLTGKIQEFVNNGGVKKIETFVTSAFNGLGSAIKYTKDNVNWLIPALSGAVGLLGAMKVISIITGLMETWKTITATQTIAQWALNASMLANPMTWVAIAIGVLIAGGVALVMNWDKVKAKAGELWSWLKEKWNGIKEACSPVTDWIMDKWNAVCNVFETVKQKALSLWNSIKEAWSSVKEFFGFEGDSTVTVNTNTRGAANSTGGRNMHKSGLDRVPYDGYQATLHKDETVLTANKASDYRHGKNSQGGDVKITIAKLADEIIVREDADIDKIADKLVNKLEIASMNLA